MAFAQYLSELIANGTMSDPGPLWMQKRITYSLDDVGMHVPSAEDHYLGLASLLPLRDLGVEFKSSSLASVSITMVLNLWVSTRKVEKHCSTRCAISLFPDLYFIVD